MRRKTTKAGGSSNFRKPPVAHQFRKGQSGNPAGRPPKNKAVRTGFNPSAGGVIDRLDAMALEEATRPVTVREGDRVSEIPAMQALLRTLFRAAAQGDTKAARQLMELIARAESGRSANAVEMLQFAHQYKERNLPIFERHERQGLDPPEIYPHPDDVIIDDNTGEIKIDGPLSKEQAGAQQILREQLVEKMRRYFEVEQLLKKDPTNRALRQEMKQLKEYLEFLKSHGQRDIRHKALKMMRRGVEQELEDDDGTGEER